MTPDEIKAWRVSLRLGEAGMAAYLGVPATTLRKWESGARQLDAAPRRLLDVLRRVQEGAPDLHAELIADAFGADAVKRPRGRPSKEKAPSLPDWMRTPH